MVKHEWHERTPEGDVRYVTAKRYAGKWKFQTCLKTDENWTSLDVLPLGDLEQLRDVLWRKYQRKRLPYEHVLEIDAMIEEAEEAEETDDLLEAGGSSDSA